MILKTFFFLLFLMPINALEIDEKLTTRFIKISESRKTVLINRGLEDGLVVGDHARFFLTTGVIARGVVVKASPTRSIWSLYRLVDSQNIYQDKVVSLKISNPIELTEDPTKSIYDKELPDAIKVARGGIPVEKRGHVLTGAPNDLKGKVDTQDLNALMKEGPQKQDLIHAGSLGNRNWEAFGNLHFNNLATSMDYGELGTAEGQASIIDFSLGVEKYFNDPNVFWAPLSIGIILHSSTNKTSAVQGQEVTNSSMEYGVTASWHFLNLPTRTNRLIAFGSVGIGVGSSEDTIDLTSTINQADADSLTGSSNFLFFGTGIKYYLDNGFGMRAQLDYYQRSELYSNSTTEEEYTKMVTGPRVHFGLAYRF